MLCDDLFYTSGECLVRLADSLHQDMKRSRVSQLMFRGIITRFHNITICKVLLLHRGVRGLIGLLFMLFANFIVRLIVTETAMFLNYYRSFLDSVYSYFSA